MLRQQIFIIFRMAIYPRFIALTLLAAVLCPQLVFAQAGVTSPSLDLQSGVAQFGSYHGGNIDTIDLSNGHLIVDIPLLGYPQRGGKLKLGWTLHYTNTGIYIPGSYPTISGCCIVFPFDSGFSPVEIGLPSFSAGCGLQQFSVPATSSSGASAGTAWQCSASVNEPDGASHPMVPVGLGVYMAEDASGYRLDVPSFNLPPLNSQHPNDQTAYLTGPDGVRYSHASSTYPIISEDTNGNQITFTGDQWTDTTGVVVPAFPPFPAKLSGPFPSGIAGSTTDYSGCTGTLPTVGAILWNPPGVNGGSYSLKFCFASVSETIPAGETTSGGVSFPVPPEPTTVVQLQSIVLPNGSTWTFSYTADGMGDLQQVRFPTGGTVSYTWTTPATPYTAGLDAGKNIIPRAIATRTMDPADGSSPAGQWTYNYDRTLTNGTFKTTVTDPQGNDTVHYFGLLNVGSIVPVYGSIAAYETAVEHYQGAASNGTLLRRDQTEYQIKNAYVFNVLAGPAQPYASVVPARFITTLDNGLQTKSENDYDAGFTSTFSGYYQMDGTPIPECDQCSISGFYGRTIATRHYDYAQGAPGPLLKAISTPHLAFANSSYLANNLLNLISSETISDGLGNLASSVTYGYDETPLVSSGVTTQHDGNPAAGTFRGNVTSVQRLLSTPANSCSSAGNSTVTSLNQWFDTGHIAQTFDPLGNSTTYSYSADLAGAYPTSVCNALNQCAGALYDHNTGLITRTTDLNGQITSYQYDPMERITQITYPAQTIGQIAIQGSTTLTYTDVPGSLSVKRIRQQDSTTSTTEYEFFDGLGRPNGTELLDPDGNTYTQTAYDAVGRVSGLTNPFRTTNDVTYGTTQTEYDALNRVTQITHPDGSTILSKYSGRAAESQDEGNGTKRVSRITQTDALGRLSSVCEVTGAAQINGDAPSACGQDIAGQGFLTTYQYDTLSNLTAVQQGGVNRDFVYDSLSRLLNARNPESGTTCYQYDAAGNVTQRTRPSPNQSDEAVTTTTSYQYDALNRLTQISYSDSVTPKVSRRYDTTSELGVPLNNTVGRLSAEYVTAPSGQLLSGRVFSYDAIGHVIDNSQCTPQNCATSTAFPIQYSYDLLGKPLTSNTGTGILFSYAYNTAGRMTFTSSNLSDGNHPGILFSSATYNPFGHLSTATLGSAVNESFGFNRRGWLTAYSSSIGQSSVASVGDTAPSHISFRPVKASAAIDNGFVNLAAFSNLKPKVLLDWLHLAEPVAQPRLTSSARSSPNIGDLAVNRKGEGQ